jgi:hypothetical protein
VDILTIPLPLLARTNEVIEITALFAAVHRSRLAHSVIRGTATFWQLLGQSGHAEPVLANLKR